MTVPIIIVTAILVVALVLLVTERVSVDVTALGIMVALGLTGILTPVEAVRGLSNPAVITVGAMFLLSAGMIRTGALVFVGRLVTDLGGGRYWRSMLLTLLIVAVASAFVNNTPVVVLFIPVVLTMSCAYEASPSKLLIPLSYASILAGTCTLIGTSTNIIVSDLAAERGLEPLGMFELARVGVPIAIAGIALIFFLAPRVMPGHAVPTCDSDDREDRRYLAEMIVPRKSALIGQDPFATLAERSATLEVFEVVRDHSIFHGVTEATPLEAQDVILLKGSPRDFVALLDSGDLALHDAIDGREVKRSNADHVVAELVVPPQSSLLGERLLDTEIFRNESIEVIAVRMRGLHYSEQRSAKLRLRVGTIILVQCDPKRLETLRRDSDFIVVEEVHEEVVFRSKARRALVIFGAVVIAASTGLADIMVCALAGALAMLLAGCMSLRDAYRSLQGSVLILIAGTIALGQAMESTGAARLYSEAMLSLVSGAPPWLILAAIIVLTSVSSQVLSNNATAVLLLPIALSTAEALDADPRAFVIAVCVGASACFATPIGYQTNLLVYGPGGYRFSDFLKLGVPLSMLVWIMGAILIPILWPL